MRILVRRYITQEKRKAENEGGTENDINEIKNNITSFRNELFEILRDSSMNTTNSFGCPGIFS